METFGLKPLRSVLMASACKLHRYEPKPEDAIVWVPHDVIYTVVVPASFIQGWY